MFNQIKADSYHLLQHKKWLMVPAFLMVPVLFALSLTLFFAPMFSQYFQEIKNVDQNTITQLETQFQDGTISLADSFKLEMARSLRADEFTFEAPSSDDEPPEIFATRKSMLENMQSTVGFASLVMMIVVILFFSEDFTTNSIRNIFTYQFDKWRYFLNKWVFGALIAFILLLSYHLINFIFSLFLFPINGDIIISLEQLLKVTVAQYPLFLTQFSLAFALIFITRKKSLSIFLAFILPLLFAFLLEMIVNRLQLPANLDFKPFYYLTQYGQGNQLTFLAILKTTIGSSIMIFCYTLLGWLGFSRYTNKQL